MTFENSLAVLLGADGPRAKAAVKLEQAYRGLIHPSDALCEVRMADIQTIADVMQAVVAYDTGRLKFATHEAQRILVSGELSWVRPLACHQGMLLGLFQTALWLDNVWRESDKTREFEDVMIDLMPTLLLSQKAEAVGHQISGKDFGDALTKAVYGFVEFPYNKGARIGTVIRILEVCEPVMADPTIPVSGIGRLMLEKLCYAQYKKIALHGRMSALIELARSLAPRPSNE